MEDFAPLRRLAELGFCVLAFCFFFWRKETRIGLALAFSRRRRRARSRSWSGRVACKGGDGGVNVVALLLAAAMLVQMFALAL